MSEKASQSYTPESLKDSIEQPTSGQVLDAFAGKHEEITAKLSEVQARPGFNLDANEMMAKRHEEKEAQIELDAFTSAYNELGGADIDAAQVAVDALDFKSNANDHVRAKAGLTAARNKFYENFLASQQSSEEDSSSDNVPEDVENSSETPADAENESKAQSQLEDRASSEDGDLEILNEGDTPDDGELEILNENENPNRGGLMVRVRSAGRRARNMTSLSGLAAEVETTAAVRRHERNGRLLNRRERIAAAMGAAALMIGGGLLLMKGHDIFGGGHHGGGSSPDVPPKGGSGAETAPPPIKTGAGTGGGVETVRVNPGDGEIKVTQRILENHGIHVDALQAQQIGESASVHDILKGDASYAHSGSAMDRIGNTGDFRVRNGVVDKLLASASKLGFRK